MSRPVPDSDETHARAETHPAADSPPPRKAKLLILSQVFVPDPASLGQHMADAAFEMARRGFRVTVFAANHGYENARLTYPSREMLDGVEILRLPFCSFGKKNLFTRVAGTVSFMVQAFFAALFTPDVNAVLFSTSPPLIGFAATLAAMVRGIPAAYWAMDLNPDQLIAMGKIRENGFTAYLLRAIDRFILRHSSLVIGLDRFMAVRLRRGMADDRKLVIIPPWPHENQFAPVDASTNPFRLRHNLDGKFVVMYSGNHSPANPLDTLLEAAVRLKNDASLRFLFVGGGQSKQKVEDAIRAHGLSNTLSLPYQPLDELRFSLSSANVHVVSLGDNMVGIVHPCKIYGAIAIARPILFFGPRPSHIADLLDRQSFGWQVAHGNVDETVRVIQEIRKIPPARLEEMGRNARKLLDEGLSQYALCKRFCDALENGLDLRNPPL